MEDSSLFAAFEFLFLISIDQEGQSASIDSGGGFNDIRRQMSVRRLVEVSLLQHRLLIRNK